MSIRLPFSLRVIQLMTNFPWKEADEDAELCPPPGLQERPQMHPTSILKDFYKFELQDQKQKKC